MITLRETATHVLAAGDRADLDVLSEFFKFQPEGYWFAPSYQRWLVSKHQEGWDGWIKTFQRFSATVGRILRGHKAEMLAVLKDQKVEIDDRKLIPPAFNLTVDDVPADILEAEFELDDHQREGIAFWLSSGIGICRVTVSGGKTAMFAGAAAMIRRQFPHARILYVTQAERLVRQATKEMQRFLPDWDIGQYGGGRFNKDAKDMVICTIAMLYKHFVKLKASGWFDSFMVLCYDEVHHCSSKTSKKVLLEIPAYIRLGASDSLKQDDEKKNTEIHGLFGPMLIDVKAAPLIKAGRIAKPCIHVIDIPEWHNRFQHITAAPVINSKACVLVDGNWHTGLYKGSVYELEDDGSIKTRTVKGIEKDEEGEWVTEEVPVIQQGLHRIEIQGQVLEVDSQWCLLERTYDKAIVQFKSRNDLIVEWALHFSGLRYPTLIVCTRTIHILVLETLLKEKLDPKLVDILFGDDAPGKRDRTFDWFRNTPGSVLITPLVKEGVSINEIRAGVVADYVSAWEVANQIVGRFIRKKPGEENRADIVWFLDRQHPVLRRGSDAMLQRLRRVAGYEWAAAEHPAPAAKPARKARKGRQ